MHTDDTEEELDEMRDHHHDHEDAEYGNQEEFNNDISLTKNKIEAESIKNPLDRTSIW